LNELETLKRSHKTAVIAAWIFFSMLFVYVVLTEVIRTSFDPFLGVGERFDYIKYRYFFYILSAVSILVVRFLRSVLLRKKHKEDIQRTALRLLRVSVITSALSELPALFGFVLFILSGISRDFYILLFVSLFLMFMFFPRYSQWRAWVEEGRPFCSSNRKQD
jgi:hypothetical protein